MLRTNNEVLKAKNEGVSGTDLKYWFRQTEICRTVCRTYNQPRRAWPPGTPRPTVPAINTVGRGLAPAGGRNTQICTALRRIRAMLWDGFLCSDGAEAAGASPRPTVSHETANSSINIHLTLFQFPSAEPTLPFTTFHRHSPLSTAIHRHSPSPSGRLFFLPFLLVGSALIWGVSVFILVIFDIFIKI